MSGFIKLHRGWRDCEVFKDEPCSQREAWVWLLENAAWKPCQRRDAQKVLVQVNRGQYHTSIRTLATAWQWSRGRVERFLNDLKTSHMISHETGHGGLLITICNYEEYQGGGPSEGPRSEPSSGPSAGQGQGHTRRKDKKLEEEKKDICASGDAPAFTVDDFVESWNEVAAACGLAKIRKLTDARRRAFSVRRREYPDIADWQSAFRCLQSNKWMHGDNKTGWRADPDFFLQAKSFTKLVENQYGQAER